jgi:hypothetical protein
MLRAEADLEAVDHLSRRGIDHIDAVRTPIGNTVEASGLAQPGAITVRLTKSARPIAGRRGRRKNRCRKFILAESNRPEWRFA